MQIIEARLRQIVLEEVQLRLLDVYINEELDKIFEQDEQNEDDDEVVAYKKAKRQAMFDKIKKGAMAAGIAGLVGGGIQSGVSDIETAYAQASAERQAQNLEQTSTIQNATKSLEDQSRNLAAQMWHAGPGEGGFRALPTNPLDKSEAILSPDWSVLKQVQIDKANGTPAYEIDQAVLDAAESHEDLRAHYKVKSKPSDTAKTFFKDFDPSTTPFTDASEISGPTDPENPDADPPSYRGVDRFLSGAPGMPSATYTQKDGSIGFQNVVHVPFEDIPEDYILPRSGLTKKELYKMYYYGQGISLEEFEMLKGDTPLDPELIQKTQDRAASLELPRDKFTWKEYRNRKKKLA